MSIAFGVDVANATQELLEEVAAGVLAESSRALYIVHKLSPKYWLLCYVCHFCLLASLVSQDCILIVVKQASYVLVREIAESSDLILQKSGVILCLFFEAKDLEGALGACNSVKCKLDYRAEARSKELCDG